MSFGPCDISVQIAEDLEVHDGHGPYAELVIQRRARYVDDILWERWMGATTPAGREVGEVLRSTWTGTLGELFELVTTLAGVGPSAGPIPE